MIKAKLPRAERDDVATAWRVVRPPVRGVWTPLGFHRADAPAPGGVGEWACGWFADEQAWQDEEGAHWFSVPAATLATVMQDSRLTAKQCSALARLQGGASTIERKV